MYYISEFVMLSYLDVKMVLHFLMLPIDNNIMTHRTRLGRYKWVGTVKWTIPATFVFVTT